MWCHPVPTTTQSAASNTLAGHMRVNFAPQLTSRAFRVAACSRVKCTTKHPTSKLHPVFQRPRVQPLSLSPSPSRISSLPSTMKLAAVFVLSALAAFAVASPHLVSVYNDEARWVMCASVSCACVGVSAWTSCCTHD